MPKKRVSAPTTAAKVDRDSAVETVKLGLSDALALQLAQSQLSQAETLFALRRNEMQQTAERIRVQAAQGGKREVVEINVAEGTVSTREFRAAKQGVEKTSAAPSPAE